MNADDFSLLAQLTAHPHWALLVAATVAVVLALVVHRLGSAVVLRLVRASTVLTAVAEQVNSPARLALPLLALQSVWQAAPAELLGVETLRHANALALIAALTWLAMRALHGVSLGVDARHPLEVEDNLGARRIRTQTRVLMRSAGVVVLIAGISLALMTFPGARQFGASLLASAGVIGLVAGIAARPVFSNLIAGLQLALAQPIRLDDVLIVQGEWGRVEEITGTYVVLKIWDERRLVIPLQWFIENPFQNWTRSSSQIIGSVFFWVDFHMPVEAVRQAAQRLCEAAPEWDGRLCMLHVIDATAQGLQLRVIVSSADSGRNWDLRCKLREGLIDWMQREYPQHLPRWRAELSQPPVGAADLNPPPFNPPPG